mmetsp:Transcript_14297/g.20222  ORF Transcript_14297/g.20222 Transcript_14297/m.20222 type:complete len:289 (+) Transcript_14297:80-946(+)|eukprot:CAMPEP_0171463276 /NCGR_PEP_ID=MMETSP0945-20130129/7004_1 /TAXON_ID=109269 /ORGANISM="Vaucheria litorea, Strain CCMP2940" /LENGTH=288 /DNA_ID=CAMNT_0011990021 /DNA_START=87 /DNA_END=953 /DNA_ORIENTATION=-
METNSPFKSNCLLGKVALITGGGSGIGFEISRQIGLHGGKVVLMGRREKFLKDAVFSLHEESIGADYYVGDVRSKHSADESVTFVVGKYGKLDILVNGAAGNFLANANELTYKGFKTVMDIDAGGVFNMSTACFGALSETESQATIVNISMTLHYGATWYQSHASAAKSAIDSLTRSFALEWGRHGISVVGIAPGPIDNTPGMAKLGPGLAEAGLARIPAGRMGSTMDIALGVIYLCSNAASFITGHTVVIDGGEWLYKKPMVLPDEVSKISRRVEGKSRAMRPTSKL